MFEKLKQNEELWNLFTRKEEYNHLMLDRYERFPYYQSQYRNILEPEVSKFLIKNGLDVEYPDERNFAVCLTHDIDVVNYPKVSAITDTVKSTVRGKIKTACESYSYLVNKKKNPWWNFRDIMLLEEKYDAKSSFYFLSLDEADLDFNFKIEELEQELGDIVDKGCEVGLHGGHEAYHNFEEIAREKKKLETVIREKVVGYRNHFLRFKVPDTWALLSKAGFKYDTTFGYADYVGFRNGMCHPFKPFNLNTNKEIDIFEIPLTIMDCTLFDYMRLDFERGWEITKLLIDTVEKYNGVLTILWHNTYLIDENLDFYEKILKYCYKKNAWMASGKDIWGWLK